MKKYFLIFYICIIVVFIAACSSCHTKPPSKQQAPNPVSAGDSQPSSRADDAMGSTVKIQAPLLFEMEKTPCYGTCPVYKIFIYTDGQCKYTGEKFVDKIGDYKRLISKDEITELINAFEENKFMEMKDEYTMNISDFPTIWITYHKKGKAKKIKDLYGAPKELKSLEKMLEQIALSDAWEKEEK